MEDALSEKLYHLAILGTTRATLSPQLVKKLAEWGIDPNIEPEKAILQAITLQRHWQKAGFQLTHWDAELSQAQAEAAKSTCSALSQKCLQEILDDTFEEALPEFIELLQKNGQVFPPIALPQLFDRCLEEPPFFQLIEPVIGRRGHWLLQQNPNWKPLCAPEESSDWLTTSFGLRQNTIVRLRKEDPRKAIELLQSTWDTERPEHRAEFLSLLQEGLSTADTSFLQANLTDRRREVRQVAADLLVLLPDSDLVQKYLQFAQTCFSMQQQGKKLELTIIFPKEFPDEWRGNGIEPMGNAPFTGVQRNGWGFQLLRRIPCRYWKQIWNTEPTAILDTFIATTDDESWLQAFADACQLHPDEEWSEAIVQYWLDKKVNLSWNSATNHQFLQKLSDEVFNRVAIRYLQKNPHLLEDRHLITYLLCISEHHWSDQLTLLVISTFQRYIGGSLGQLWHTAHYTRIIKALAYHCDPQLLIQLSKGWDPSASLWGRWRNEVEKMLEIIAFRQKLNQSFSATPTLN